MNNNQELKNLWRDRTLHSIICHEGQLAYNGRYTCGVLK